MPNWWTARSSPQAWERDGWMAAWGTKRKREPVLQHTKTVVKDERWREHSIAEPRVAYTVGDRVQARYLASKLPGKRYKTHWFDGHVTEVQADGSSYCIRYDDGDYEEDVKRRFVRAPRAQDAEVEAAGAPGLPGLSTIAGGPGRSKDVEGAQATGLSAVAAADAFLSLTAAAEVAAPALAVTASSSTQCTEATMMEAVKAALDALGLSAYASVLEEEGFDDLEWLVGLHADKRREVADAVGMHEQDAAVFAERLPEAAQ